MGNSLDEEKAWMCTLALLSLQHLTLNQAAPVPISGHPWMLLHIVSVTSHLSSLHLKKPFKTPCIVVLLNFVFFCMFFHLLALSLALNSLEQERGKALLLIYCLNTSHKSSSQDGVAAALKGICEANRVIGEEHFKTSSTLTADHVGLLLRLQAQQGSATSYNQERKQIF